MSFGYNVLGFGSHPSRGVPLAVEWLLIAGGGASHTGGPSGGGGGGGYLTAVTDGITPATSFFPGIAYTVTVGAGGANGGNPGVDSSVSGAGLTTILSIGGGRGGAGLSFFPSIGGSGGGGAGAQSGGYPYPQAGAIGTVGPPRQGYTGGAGYMVSGYNSYIGGGGGGAGGNGTGAVNQYFSSTGGGGRSFEGVGRAGGGGGSGNDGWRGGVGSSGGGSGNSYYYNRGNQAGYANTGGGGGGGAQYAYAPPNRPAPGGSGIAIFKYEGGTRATGGTITFVSGYTLHTFNSSGTFTPL